MATVSCVFHPHHVSLIDTHSFHAKLQYVGDSYYNIDGLSSHKHVLTPKFDVLDVARSRQVCIYVVEALPVAIYLPKKDV